MHISCALLRLSNREIQQLHNSLLNCKHETLHEFIYYITELHKVVAYTHALISKWLAAAVGVIESIARDSSMVASIHHVVSCTGMH